MCPRDYTHEYKSIWIHTNAHTPHHIQEYEKKAGELRAKQAERRGEAGPTTNVGNEENEAPADENKEVEEEEAATVWRKEVRVCTCIYTKRERERERATADENMEQQHETMGWLR